VVSILASVSGAAMLVFIGGGPSKPIGVSAIMRCFLGRTRYR
jgi:hypothetical protein